MLSRVVKYGGFGARGAGALRGSSRAVQKRNLSLLKKLRVALPKVTNLLSLSKKEDIKAVTLSKKQDSKGNPLTLAAVAAAPIVTGPPAQVLSVLGPAFYMYLQYSGLSTCQKIKKDGTTGDFSPAQFVSLYTNGAVWVIYGALAQDMTVLIPNSTAVLAGLYYTSVFASYHKESMMKWYVGSAAILAGTGYAATLPNAIDIVGISGCTMAVILLSSPLAVMGKVIKDKSTAALPFGASLAGFLNATSWTAYGSLVAMDPYIYAPNGLGMCACAVQLGLFAVYGFPKATPAAAEAAPVEADAAESEAKPEEEKVEESKSK